MSRPKKDDSYSVPLKAPDNNGHGSVAWGQIVEIRTVEVPLKRMHQSIWEKLYRELILRLEQTDARHALAIPFEDYRLLKLARIALYKRFQRSGVGFAEITIQKNPPTLYVMRGKNWHP